MVSDGCDDDRCLRQFVNSRVGVVHPRVNGKNMLELAVECLPDEVGLAAFKARVQVYEHLVLHTKNQ